MSESDVLSQIKNLLSLKGVRIFRNQVGAARTLGGMRITTGLGKGSSDLIGYRTVKIGDQKIAQFVAIEVKDGDSTDPTKEQLDFLEEVRSAGGIGILARKLEDVVGL